MPRQSMKLAIALGLAVSGAALAQVGVPGGQLDRPGPGIVVQPGAEGQQGQRQQIARIGSFVGEDTIAIGRLDLAKVDVQAAQGWFKELAKAVESDPQRQQAVLNQLNAQFGVAQWWVDNMKKAGAQNVYSVINSRPDEQPISALVVPLDPQDNAEQIRQLLMPKADANQMDPRFKLNSAVIRDAVVVAPQGMLDALQQARQTDPESLNAAMESVKGSAIQVAFTPTANMKQWVQRMVARGENTLPQDVQAGELGAIPERVEWAAIGIDSPPEQSMKIIVNATNDQAARQIRDTVTKVLNAARQNKDIAANVPDIQRITETLTPRVEGEQLTVTLDKEEFNRIFRQDLPQALRRARGEQPIRATDIPNTEQEQKGLRDEGNPQDLNR